MWKNEYPIRKMGKDKSQRSKPERLIDIKE